MSTLTWQMVILTAGWIAMLGFAIGYPLLARPWYKSQFGRSLEASEISMVVLVGLSLCGYWFTFVLPDPAATAIIVLISTSAWMRFIAMLTEQLRRNPKAHPRVDAVLGQGGVLEPPVHTCPTCGTHQGEVPAE